MSDALSIKKTSAVKKRLPYRPFFTLPRTGISLKPSSQRKKIRLFPSSFLSNTRKCESLFQKHYKDHSLERRTGGKRTSWSPARHKEEVMEEPPKKEVQAPTRRATRSSGHCLDDWIKLPVAATVRVVTGSLETLDGFVYLSAETARLFKQHGKVYFETSWQGNAYKFFVPEDELPMISEDHPLFKEECKRIEDERVKKLTQAKHMLELTRANELATYEAEQRCADKTLQVRQEELKERMLERLEDEMEDLEEDLELAEEEDVAVRNLEAIRGPRPKVVPVFLERQGQQVPHLSSSHFSRLSEPFALSTTMPSSTPSAAAPGKSSHLTPILVVNEPVTSIATEEAEEEREASSLHHNDIGRHGNQTSISLPSSPFGEAQREPSPDPFMIELDHEPMMDFDSIPLMDLEQTLPEHLPTEDAPGLTTTEGPAGGVSSFGTTARHGLGTMMGKRMEDGEGLMLGDGGAGAAAAAASKTGGDDGGQREVKEWEEKEEEEERMPKKRKVNAADLAMKALAIASDISVGLKEIKLVYDREYDDIDNVLIERMYPDEDFGEDEDLITT